MIELPWPLLADENVHPDVVLTLRRAGNDVISATDSPGTSDESVLRRAFAEGRVVLTHDADLATLAVRDSVPTRGIIYLRPGHVRADFVLETLRRTLARAGALSEPFILVGDRRGDTVHVRMRLLEHPTR